MNYVTKKDKTSVYKIINNKWVVDGYLKGNVIITDATPIIIQTANGSFHHAITKDHVSVVLLQDVIPEATSSFGGEAIDMHGSLAEVNLGADGTTTGVISVPVIQSNWDKFISSFTTKNVLIGIVIVAGAYAAYRIVKGKSIIPTLTRKK